MYIYTTEEEYDEGKKENYDTNKFDQRNLYK